MHKGVARFFGKKMPHITEQEAQSNCDIFRQYGGLKIGRTNNKSFLHMSQI